MTQGFTRVAGWPRLLNQHLVESQRRYGDTGLQWGVFDCCTFAFDWVLAATGVDVMDLADAPYRGRYDSREAALRLFWANGDKTLEGALARVFGDPVPPAQGRRGDIVFREDQDACLGVMITQGVHQAGVFLGEGGFMFVELGEIQSAFRV